MSIGQNILDKDTIKSLGISQDQKTDHFPPIVQCGINLEGLKATQFVTELLPYSDTLISRQCNSSKLDKKKSYHLHSLKEQLEIETWIRTCFKDIAPLASSPVSVCMFFNHCLNNVDSIAFLQENRHFTQSKTIIKNLEP